MSLSSVQAQITLGTQTHSLNIHNGDRMPFLVNIKVIYLQVRIGFIEYHPFLIYKQEFIN